MNEYERLRRQAIVLRDMYPPGTRVAVLIVDRNGEYHVGRIRRLTPRECWRLQGFTDEQFDRAVGAGISDSQLYKMAGNAVSVPVITAIGRVIKEVEERNTQNA